jgi:hypothetical protein
MFTKKHSDENKAMLERAQYTLRSFAKEYVIEDLQQIYPDVDIKRIRSRVDQAERILRGRQIRKNLDKGNSNV